MIALSDEDRTNLLGFLRRGYVTAFWLLDEHGTILPLPSSGCEGTVH